MFHTLLALDALLGATFGIWDLLHSIAVFLLAFIVGSVWSIVVLGLIFALGVLGFLTGLGLLLVLFAVLRLRVGLSLIL